MKKYSYEEFIEIIKTLRSENGCPWDREQTHESLRPCMMEEAAEVLSAIRILEKTGNAENLQEELGDVLLQVVMHARIAEEEGLFSMEDVVNDVAAKMVRRHPHVFGDVQASTSDEVLNNWDEIKKQEKEGKSWIESPLREVPQELPALTRAVKILKKADKLYGRHVDYAQAVTAIKEAVSKLEECSEEEREFVLKDELGNLLIAAADMARLHKLPVEQILADRIEDMIEDYEEEIKEKG